MKRLKGLLGKGEFHLLLFHVCLILFGWPVVAFHDLARLEAMFVYLFLAWGAVICLLILMGKSLGAVAAPEETESVREER
jgi:hypothetical protein